MTKKILCAVDDTEHATSAVGVAAELAKATEAELTLLAVNVPVGGPARGGIMIFAWEDADLKHVLDGATAIAKKAGVSEPNAKSRCGPVHRRLCRGQRHRPHCGRNRWQRRGDAADVGFGFKRRDRSCTLPRDRREIAVQQIATGQRLPKQLARRLDVCRCKSEPNKQASNKKRDPTSPHWYRCAPDFYLGAQQSPDELQYRYDRKYPCCENGIIYGSHDGILAVASWRLR